MATERQAQSASDSSVRADGTELFAIGEFVVDLRNERVTHDGTELTMPKLSFDLLTALIRDAPHCVTTDRLMDVVWPRSVVGADTVAQRVKLLRDTLGDSASEPRYIESIRGRGYRLVAKPVSLDDAPAGAVRMSAPELPHTSSERLARRVRSLRVTGGAVAAAAAIAVTAWLVLAVPTDESADRVTDSEAYSLYVQALVARLSAAGVNGRSEDRALEVEALLTSALERDDRFAAAYAERAAIRMAMFLYNVDTSERHFQSIRDDLAAATSLAPRAPKTLAATAWYELWINRDLDRAAATFNGAISAGLADPMWMFDVAILLVRDGRIDEGLALAEHALAINPDNEVAITLFANLLSTIRRPGEALRLVDAGLEKTPDEFALALQRLQLLLGWSANMDALLEAAAKAPPVTEALEGPGWPTRLVLNRMRYEPAWIPAGEPLEEGTQRVRATFSGVGSEPIARYHGWIDMLLNNLPGASEASRQIIDFLSATPETAYNRTFRKLLEAEAHTFGRNREAAIAVARDAARSAKESPVDTLEMRLAVAIVLAWNGEHDQAVEMLTELTTGIPALPPGTIIRDALIVMPLSGHDGYRALAARLNATLAALDLD